MRLLLPLLLGALLSACGGGSDTPAPAPAPVPNPGTNPPPPVTASMTLSSPTLRTITGGGAVPLTATLSSGGAVRWQLPAGAPGTLSADTGGTVRYQPPAGVLAAPAAVTISATGDGASASLTLAVASETRTPGLFEMPWRDSSDMTLHRPSSIATDIAGNTYVVSYNAVSPSRRGSPRLYKIAPDNSATPLIDDNTWFGQGASSENAHRLDWVSSLAVDRAGNLYFGILPLGVALTAGQQSLGGSTILKVTPTGVISVLAGSAEPQVGAITDGSGSAARFLSPSIVGIDFDDNLYVRDGGNVVRKVTTAGNVTTVASLPRGLMADKDGNTYEHDGATNKLVRTGPAGARTIVTDVPYCADGAPVRPRACLPNAPYRLIPTGGASYVVFDGASLLRLIMPSPHAPPAAALTLSSPTLRTIAGGSAIPLTATLSNGGAVRWRLATGSRGSLSANMGATVRYLPPADALAGPTTATVIAEADGASAALTLALAPAPGGSGLFQMPWRDSNEPTMHRPSSIATDIAGNTYVLSYAAAAPTRRGTPHLYKIAPDNTVTVMIDDSTWFGQPASSVDPTGRDASRLAWVSGFAVGNDGEMFFSITPGGFGLSPGESSSSGPAILQVSPSGAMRVLAGSTDPQTGAMTDGSGSAARFLNPAIIGADFDGNIYLRDGDADGERTTLRKVMRNGLVSTVTSLPPSLWADKDGATYAFDTSSAKLVRTSADGIRTPVTNIAYCAAGTPTPPMACLGNTGVDLKPVSGVSYVVFDGYSLRRLILPH